MTEINPNLDWYLSESKSEGATPRCPYANAHRCPRYYSSLYLLGDVRITTRMSPEKIKELDAYWEGSDLLPVVAEHDTGIGGGNGKHTDFCNFCPEISFDIYGLFSSSLHRHLDEIDRDMAHQKLIEENNTGSWRWNWAHIEPMHYLKCPVYSQILNSKPRVEVAGKGKQEILTLKPTIFGFSIDLKAIFNRWKSRNASNKTN